MSTTTDHYTHHDMDYAAQLGWTYVSNISCPRRLIRKHCRNWYRGETCWCRNPLNDHGATWRHTRTPWSMTEYIGTRFVLWQPYGARGDDLAQMLAGAKQDGLNVIVSDQAVWRFPGEPSGCIGIQFYKAL